jgi:2,5-diketo-D-gluconate reductase A
VSIPAIGFGTWPLVGGEARRAVTDALSLGYRLIDTSEQYANEEEIGRAIRSSGVPRADVVVSTKFNARWHGVELAQQACDAALARLGTDYLDLFLIHWPNPWLDRYVDAWRGLIALREQGKVRAIGVSNFLPAHIDRLIAETGVTPEVNQIELDPTLPQAERRAYHDAHGIVTQAWGPLGRDGRLLHEPVVVELARRHAVAPAQIVLRWHIEHGLAFTARSSARERIAQNIALFDFALGPEDLERMRSLDTGRAPARDPERHGH